MRNELITFTSPKSSVSEVFRTLRTNVQFINASNKLKSILVTSTVPGEGKSYVSANLAITFAQAGKRVVLVDADMRKGRQHEVFELSNENGLSNYLISAVEDDKIDLGDYIKPTIVENLYVMTAGIVPPNPAELLTSQKMSDLIKALEKSADIVIFDGTPSTIVTDALIISRSIGSTLIVTSHKQTKMEDLKQIKKNIENVGGKIAGVVVNKVPRSQKIYGGGYYYESSIIVNNKKKWLDNIFNSIHKTDKKQEDIKMKKEVEKLKSVPKKENVKAEKPKATRRKKQDIESIKKEEEDIDINLVLKQLTKYLSEEKK